jgi:S1-C subfamily serine protease
VAVLGDLRVVAVTPAIRQERAIRSERGALIYELSREAQQATGLQPGDVIFQFNRTPIQDADDLQRAFRAAEGGGAATLWIERSRQVARTSFYVR